MEDGQQQFDPAYSAVDELVESPHFECGICRFEAYLR